MEINPGIFKAYDIRGVYPSEINEDTVYNIGRALARFTKAKTIVIGKDIRKSSDSLEEKMIEGMTDEGVNVIKIGISTTPMLYFASWNLDVDAGVIITASHNPAEYNGMKFCFKGAVPIGEGSGMEEVKQLALEGNFEPIEDKGNVFEDEKLKQKYLDYITGFFNKEVATKKKKIVVDFANAMGILDKEVLENMGDSVEKVYLYDQYDGSFPNHEANPLKTETLEALQKKVLEEGADLGVSYDGDADRVGFVDEKGKVIPMDFVTALLAKEILKKHPGSKILMDLRGSNSVKEVIEEAGGVVSRCRVGHSLIKKQMREEGAIFAGELSGHYYFEENSKAELATLAVVTLLNLLNETGMTMSELTEDLKRYFHSGEINSEVADVKVVLKQLEEKYSDGEMDRLDGIRIDFKDWWFNVRASNTEPVLRLNLEAKTKELMEEKRDELLAVIRG